MVSDKCLSRDKPLTGPNLEIRASGREEGKMNNEEVTPGRK